MAAEAGSNQLSRRGIRFTARHAIVAGLLVVATALRLWGLKWGLPDPTHLFSYHPDEYHSLRGLLSLVLHGELNPHFFNYGSLYLYLISAAAMLGHGRLIFSLSPESFPQTLRLWTLDARLVSVVAGVLTVLVIYLLARRLLGNSGAIFSALLLAVAPLHLLNCHYGTVDVTQTLFIALTLLFSVRLMSSQRWQDCAWAGVMVGLAASTKYNGIVVAVAPLSAILLTVGKGKPGGGRSGWLKNLLIMSGCVVLAFALTSPFTFLAWPEAKQDIAFELQHMRLGEPLQVAAEPSGLLFHAKNLLAPGVGPMVILAALGLVIVLVSRQRKLLPVAAFAILWTILIALARVRYARYEVALLPALLVLGVLPIAQLLRAGRWRRAAGYMLAAICLIPVLYWSGQLCWSLANFDPRGQALQAIVQDTPTQSQIGLVREPWFDVPPVDYCNGGAILRRNYQLYQQPVRNLVITDFDPVALAAQRPYSFVLSEFNSRAGLRAGDERVVNFVMALLADYKLVSSYGGMPLAGVPWELGSDWLYPWPRIQIYLCKDATLGAGGN